jgi:hypothetical protein
MDETLPAMGRLPDGRFALRVGLSDEQTWEVRRLVSGAWMLDCYLTDAQAYTQGMTDVEPLSSLASVVAELETAGQFAAARTVSARQRRMRTAWAGA